ncbi:MAG: methylmalonyl Co-A mutase-associated GTPase MeaB [Bacteroidales bacterium]|nr:methylmalonyl Co-A mutase-associated GTPase MeaB [Bacteroidales bacterium]
MKKKESHHSALSVSNGIEQPSSVNEAAVARLKHQKRKPLSSKQFLEGILSGNRIVLSQAITLIESSLPQHQEKAQKIIEKCLPYSGNSTRIGITGVPGVGKSSFIETFGLHLTSLGHKLAVLAIDPSSERSKGSILGDKTRMEELSTQPNAFIRPSPSAGSLGGVARKTRETIILCETAGFDTIIIETVGVGQSETAVHSMVDFFLLLMLAGAGDELQGIKRGIMEMADAIAITKADYGNIQKANRAKAEYTNALHLFPPSPSGWIPKVLTCSAHKNEGIKEIRETINEYENFIRKNGFFSTQRSEQAKYWLFDTLNRNLQDHFYLNPEVKKHLLKYQENVLDNKISPFVAARKLLNKYFKE